MQEKGTQKGEFSSGEIQEAAVPGLRGLARVPAESPDKTSKTSKTRRKKLHVGAKLN